jgi:hypothetical protein
MIFTLGAAYPMLTATAPATLFSRRNPPRSHFRTWSSIIDNDRCKSLRARLIG